jgi:hypothetical protein
MQPDKIAARTLCLYMINIKMKVACMRTTMMLMIGWQILGKLKRKI